MTDEKPPSLSAPTSSAASVSEEPVRELNPNDVLLGRGHGSSKWVGNIQFRDVVKSRKDEYINGTSSSKTEVANEVMKHISSKGGRFLYLDRDAKPVNNIVKEGVWYECSYKVALEKTKQALRENRGGKKRGQTNIDDLERGDGELEGTAPGPDGTPSLVTSHSSLGLGSGRPATALSIEAASALSAIPPPTNVLPVLPSTLVGARAAQPTAEGNLTLFQRNPLAFHLYSQLGQSPRIPAFASFPPQSHLSAEILLSQFNSSFAVNPAYAVAQQRYDQLRILSILQEQAALTYNVQGESSDVGVASMPKDESCAMSEGDTAQGKSNITGGDTEAVLTSGKGVSKRSNEATEVASVPKNDASPLLQAGEDVLEFLLSILALSGRQQFTEDQGKLEKVNMTDEERVRVLCDIFGNYCNTHQNKKARKDLSTEEVAFLVKQMRIEIERIPEARKDALMKAQVKCRAEEFSDERLERFLRCDGMDVKVRMSVLLHCFAISYSHTVYFATCVHEAGSSALCKLLGESSQSVWPGEVSHADGFE